MKHFLQAVKIQAWADIRPWIFGISALNILSVPALWVVLGRWMTGTVEGFNVTMGHYLIASSLVGFATMIAIQISSETYNEYMAGTLLRVRTLPNGVSIWSTAKLLTSGGIILITILLILIATVLFIPSFELTWPKIAASIPFLLLTLLASAPLGFIVGVFTRSLFTMFLSLLFFLGLMIISGIFFPIEVLPGWLQGITKVFPTYHGGVVSRWIFIDSPEPVLTSILVLAVWFIIGMAVSRWVIATSFKSVSLGQTARAQQGLKTAMGI